jgi:MFS family permease
MAVRSRTSPPGPSTRNLEEFYAVAAVFGLAYGGVMPLYAVLARDYFGPRVTGTVFGAATIVSCLGMAAGPAVGGWIFDCFGIYARMHLASLAIGSAPSQLPSPSRCCPRCGQSD